MQFAEVQKALFSALNGNVGVPVHEDTPQGSEFPYVTIGDNSYDDFGADTERGNEVEITVRTWSRDESIGETLLLQGVVNELLDRSVLNLDTWCNLGLTLDFSTVIKDPDGKTKQGVLRYNAIIGEID